MTISVPESGTQKGDIMENNTKKEELELFMLKRKILYELRKIDKSEEFIISIDLSGKEEA